MNRFAIAVLAVGLALSSDLASQLRGQFAGSPVIPELSALAGTTQGLGGASQAPGSVTSAFEVKSADIVTVIEEHYRTQLAAAGWRVEATGGDANGAFSRFSVTVGPDRRAGMLLVMPLATGRAQVTLRVVEPMAVPPPAAPKTGTAMMDWMLRQLPRQLPGETLATALSALPGTFPMELLPARFKSSRILAAANRVTVAGTVDKTTPSDISMFFVELRKAGWLGSPRQGFAHVFALGEFCRNDTRASFVFNVEPRRVAMAAVSTDTPPDLGCQYRASRSLGYSFPIVVVPTEWVPAHFGGGGNGETRWRSDVRLNTTTPITSILADFESQIAAAGYKAVSRTIDANVSYVRFESTPAVGLPAVVMLSLTRLPWSPQIDAVIDAIGLPPR